MLAVLPFQNLSGDPTQDYFGDGLTEEMIAQLGQSNPARLRVIARTSAMHYKGTTQTVAQIGHELGADYVVESSIRREGDRVRITTQLVRVSDQSQVWARSYERDSRVMLMLQKELAGDVAARIAQKIAPGGRAQRSAAVLNPKAYDSYLKGRFSWNERTEQGHLKAIEDFKQAIAADPDYAQAYSGLADAYALLGSNPTTAITRQEAMARARAAALKALAIDDTLAEAHASLAFIYWHYDWNWPAAEKEFQRALQLNPSYPTAHEWYALYLVSQNRVEQALAEIRRAQQTDPLSLIINTDAAEILFYAQQYDASIEQARSVLELDPEFSLAREILAWSYLAERQYEPAVDELNQGMHASGANFPLNCNLAAIYAITGQRAKARDVLRHLEAESERQHAGQLMMAIAGVQAALGENDQAFASLEKDFQQRDGALTLLRFVPVLDSLHQDPRFANLVHRIGLPEQDARDAVPASQRHPIRLRGSARAAG